MCCQKAFNTRTDEPSCGWLKSVKLQNNELESEKQANMIRTKIFWGVVVQEWVRQSTCSLLDKLLQSAWQSGAVFWKLWSWTHKRKTLDLAWFPTGSLSWKKERKLFVHFFFFYSEEMQLSMHVTAKLYLRLSHQAAWMCAQLQLRFHFRYFLQLDSHFGYNSSACQFMQLCEKKTQAQWPRIYCGMSKDDAGTFERTKLGTIFILWREKSHLKTRENFLFLSGLKEL